MKIILAPMEGLTDVHMRHILTQMAGSAGFDWCVTEFIRITSQLLPERVFYQYCPELLNGGNTAAGTPVHVQLLGSEAQIIAENAQRAAELGAPAIDLNFGCPAKSVNQHRGGAVLLEEPELVHAIVAAVALPTRAAPLAPGRPRRVRFADAEGVFDDGVVWLAKGPATATGEDTAELTCHGNPLLAQRHRHGRQNKRGRRVTGQECLLQLRPAAEPHRIERALPFDLLVDEIRDRAGQMARHRQKADAKFASILRRARHFRRKPFQVQRTMHGRDQRQPERAAEKGGAKKFHSPINADFDPCLKYSLSIASMPVGD